MTEPAAVNHDPKAPRKAPLNDVAAIRRLAVIVARRIVARDGAGRLTLDSVAHEAGLPTGSLANQFDNEQELLMAIAADDLADLAKAMRGHAGTSHSAVPLDLIQRVKVLEDAFANIME